MNHRQDILTERLSLISITPASVHAEQTGGADLGPVTNATVPPAWPPKDWEPHVLKLLATRFAADPDDIGWHRYVALSNGAERTLIGTVGGFRHAERPNECEAGYSLLPAYQGRGYATEAMNAFVAWAFHHPFLQAVVAQTYPTLPASIRVMQKAGLTFAGAGFEEGTILYRRER